MDQPQKPSLLQGLSPTQMFVGGIVTGVLVLCTIGFFILLCIFLRGGGGLFASFDGTGTYIPENGSGAPAGNGANGGIAGGMLGLAKEAGVKDLKKFESCWKEAKYAAKVQKDEADAQAVGMQGTPYTVVMGPGGKMYPISGAYPFSTMEGVILTLQGKAPPAGAEIPSPLTGVTPYPIDPKTEFVRGNVNAAITIIEYSDFECPFCKRFHATMQQVMEKYGKDVKWVYRHSPIDSLHPQARTESHAVECAGEQGKYWELTDLIFKVTPGNNGLIL